MTRQRAKTRHQQPGVIYLLHFDQPYKHAKHYTGWTEDLLHRLDRHAAGNGARLSRSSGKPGSASPWSASAKAPARPNAPSRTPEALPGTCPACTPHPRNGHWMPITGDLIPRTYPNPAGRR